MVPEFRLATGDLRILVGDWVPCCFIAGSFNVLPLEMEVSGKVNSLGNVRLDVVLRLLALCTAVPRGSSLSNLVGVAKCQPVGMVPSCGVPVELCGIEPGLEVLNCHEKDSLIPSDKTNGLGFSRVVGPESISIAKGSRPFCITPRVPDFQEAFAS